MAFSADQLLEKVNTYLATMPYVREPKGLYAPIEYVLSLGGKRIRPVLMLLSRRASSTTRASLLFGRHNTIFFKIGCKLQRKSGTASDFSYKCILFFRLT
jgi:geranylgeranyl pyrophosphate synthase